MKKDVEGKIVGLQVLRILACLMIFLVNFSEFMNFEGNLSYFCSYGNYAVYLFFILSGFLALYELDKESEIKVSHYYFKRFLRIAPLFYLIIIANIITHVFIYQDVPTDNFGLSWLRYFLFIFQIIPTDNEFWINISSVWTIGIFVIFYLMAPFIKKAIDNYKSALFITVIIFILNKYYYLYIKDGYFNFINYLYPFFFGVTAYLVNKENKENIFIIICVILSFLTQNNILLYISLFTILLFAMLKIKIENKTILKIINSLDKYSYGICLIHPFIIETLYHYEFNVYLGAIIVIIGTILVSYILTNLIASPIYKYGKKLINK